ncbi:MAG: acyl-CoA synthetase, partial [Treponema sp.]|nr:acyl-CoA synthetase [Treponema sp.]
VFNNDGIEKFRGSKKLEINRFFHDYLMQFFENIVIPKRYRYVEKLPCDVQGKVHKDDVAALFKKSE